MRVPHLRRHGSAFVADDATVVGRVTLAPGVSVWYGTVIRGDVASISIGRDTNVQDLTVVHPQHDEDVVVGEKVTIGHSALVHGRTVGDLCLIGMGAILLPGSRVGNCCIIGAGALVPIGMVVPDRSLVLGSPGRVVRQVTEKEVLGFQDIVDRYKGLVLDHLREEPSP